MKKLNKMILLLLVFFMVASSVFAAGGRDPAGQIRIGYTTMDLANPYFMSIVAGMEERAAELGVTLIVHDARQDPAAQVAGIENFIVQRVDAMIITPFGDAHADVARRVYEAGIPIINLNQEYTGHKDLFFTIPEHEYGLMIGVQAGRWIRDRLGGEAEFGLLVREAIPDIVHRAEGIIAGIHQYAPNARIVSRQEALTPAEGMAAAEIMLTAHPNIQVIVGFNDSTALGAYEAVMASGRPTANFFVGGVDAVPEAIARLREGGIYRGTVDIDPWGTGRRSIDLAMEFINGTRQRRPFSEAPIPRDTWISFPSREVNQQNVNQIFPQ
jgi:ABC-type sugar transport system substrate-binding protein